jgi:16S rRNA (cytidine1402-2'-O)-methyltransferase
VQVLLERADAGGEVRAGRRVVSVFEGNEAARADAIVAELAAGKDVALVSEAGTPGVSDPGERVVKAAIAAGASVVPVPGPVAAIAALVASGLPATEFRFIGFPPREAGARGELFGRLRSDAATLLCYEAPDRVGATLATLAEAFGGERRACVSREVTKRYEEHVRGTLAELAATFAEAGPRGECTIVVAGAGEGEVAPVVDLEAEVRALLASGLGPKDVAQRLMVKTGRPRRELYQLALALARADEGDSP